jgi:hypothetical protein
VKTRNTVLLGKLLLDHPRSLGETYWQHQRRALRFGISMIGAGAACLVHALLPAVFERTASSTVQRLYDEMRAARRLGGVVHDRPTPLVTRISAPARGYGTVSAAFRSSAYDQAAFPKPSMRR